MCLRQTSLSPGARNRIRYREKVLPKTKYSLLKKPAIPFPPLHFAIPLAPASSCLLLVTSVLLLAYRQWDIAVLDHVLYLATHSQSEEYDPVDYENRPEDYIVAKERYQELAKVGIYFRQLVF